MPKKSQNTKQAQSPNPMEALLQKSTMSNIHQGAEMDAKILNLSRRNVLFDVGAKALAVLGEKELKEISTYLPYLKEGDKVRVRIIADESREGYPVVSMRRFFEKGKWNILNDKKQKEDDIDVICGEYGKGGVFIDFMGIRGVIPKIQLTEDFLQSPEIHKLNFTFPFKQLRIQALNHRNTTSFTTRKRKYTNSQPLHKINKSLFFKKLLTSQI